MNGEIGRTIPIKEDRKVDAPIQEGERTEPGRDREVPGMETQHRDMPKEEGLAPLFLRDVAKDYRSRWDVIQRNFVDDPRQAVREADDLVAEVMKSLEDTFAQECRKIEAEMDRSDQPSTENLRVGLRRYRSFFDRLLAL